MNTPLKYDMIGHPTLHQDDDLMTHLISNLSLYELMAEDHSVWLTKNKKFGFDIEIENEDGEMVVKEEGVHPYAMESLFLFCKRFISVFESQCEEAKNV